MTRGSIWEYLEAIRGRYLRAGKQEGEGEDLGRGRKGRILDEAEQVTGSHRKALIRVLRRHGD